MAWAGHRVRLARHIPAGVSVIAMGPPTHSSANPPPLARAGRTPGRLAAVATGPLPPLRRVLMPRVLRCRRPFGSTFTRLLAGRIASKRANLV